jgi:dephospho-CoA kinase
VPDAPRRAPIIGLVGGIGSGKSHLARKLLEKHSIEIVEGDSAGHLVLEDLPVQQQLRKIFGSSIFTPEGKVDRRKLGRLVFGATPQQQAARNNLEKIVHPRITEILKSQLERAQARDRIEAIILDAALIVEAGWRHFCDAVVFVDTPYEERLARVSRQRGWDRDELDAREASQLPLEQKRKEAQYVVDNSGDGPSAQSQLEEIYSRIVSLGHT